MKRNNLACTPTLAALPGALPSAHKGPRGNSISRTLRIVSLCAVFWLSAHAEEFKPLGGVGGIPPNVVDAAVPWTFQQPGMWTIAGLENDVKRAEQSVNAHKKWIDVLIAEIPNTQEIIKEDNLRLNELKLGIEAFAVGTQEYAMYFTDIAKLEERIGRWEDYIVRVGKAIPLAKLDLANAEQRLIQCRDRLKRFIDASGGFPYPFGGIQPV